MLATTFEEELQYPHGDYNENSSLPYEIAGKNQNVWAGRPIKQEYQRGAYYNKQVGSVLFKVKINEEGKRNIEVNGNEDWKPIEAMFW